MGVGRFGMLTRHHIKNIRFVLFMFVWGSPVCVATLCVTALCVCANKMASVKEAQA